MGFRIETKIEEDFLPRVMEIDEIVYSSEYMGGGSHEYVGKIENMQNRFRANSDSFVCLIDEENGRLAGYINYFPCTEELYDDIVRNSPVIRDDDINIVKQEISDYSRGGNHLFILSVAVHPDYQGRKEAAKELSDGWIRHLNEIQENGFPITDISAAAVSPKGKKWLSDHLFVQERRLSDGNVVYLCQGKMLEKLLANDLYIKSYRNDIYLMLPLADHLKNTRLNVIFAAEDEGCASDSQEAEGDSGKYRSEYYIDALQESLRYECTNEVMSELQIADLGKLTFLHTTDDYPQGSKDAGKKIVVGESEGYAVLTAHRDTHMYVLTLILPDCAYSTTRVEDQLSYGYLRILTDYQSKVPVEMDLYEYLLKRYGLHRCGQGKCLLCMSNMPEDKLEFEHILLGEAYNSMKVDYHAKSDRLSKLCEESRQEYDYYKVYLSETAIAFILEAPGMHAVDEQKRWFRQNLRERIETMATYSFVVEVVMFQNIALSKATNKISNALANGGDISHEQVERLYRDFGRTVHFWEVHNFKYAGAQAEAEHVADAFGNNKLKENYFEHQEFLEHMVDLKSSQIQERNGMIISIVGTVLAVIQIMDPMKAALDHVVAFLNRFYSGEGGNAAALEETEQAVRASSLTLGIVILCLLAMVVCAILKQKRKNMREINMRSAKREGKEFYEGAGE